MRISTATSTDGDLARACREAAALAAADLGGARADWGLLFVSARYGAIERAPDVVLAETGVRHLAGCSAGGIVGNDEIEGRPAVSVMLADAPGMTVRGVHLEEDDLPGPDAPPSAWESRLGAPRGDTRSMVLLPEPFTFSARRLLEGVDFAYPGVPKFGGLASGSAFPRSQTLFLDHDSHRSGCVVVSLGGEVVVETRVAQGCKPFGSVGEVTRADGHDLIEVEGKPAGVFLEEQLRTLAGEDLETAKTTPLFLGVAMDPFAAGLPSPGEFLIRNVLDYDPERRTLRVGELLTAGRRIQFHLRDRRTSESDLRERLTQPWQGTAPPAGALLFSCLGRGRHLYGREGHDSTVFREMVGDLPLCGFFCNGEIGPVGGTTHLHGYTSVFALLGGGGD